MIWTIFSLLVLLFSVALHEAAHGFMAYKLGDPTAKYEGRLSLNPVKHLDPFGSLVFPAITLFLTKGRGPIFGWAKPVPINPYNFKDQKWGEIKSAMAGPLANVLLALICGSLARFCFNFFFIFNALSIICLVNLSLAVFNLIPIPPLDGSHILLNLFPYNTGRIKAFFHQYSFLFLFILIFFGMDLIQGLVSQLYYLIIGYHFLTS